MSRGPWKKKTEGITGSDSKLFGSLIGTAVDKKETAAKKQTETIKASTSGKEIIPIIEVAKPVEESKDGEVIDLTDDELKELLGLLFQETGNLALRILKRQLIEDREASTFGKLSVPYFRAKLKEKMNMGIYAPMIFAALVLVSKPLTPEGEKLKAEKEKLKKEMEVKK